MNHKGNEIGNEPGVWGHRKKWSVSSQWNSKLYKRRLETKLKIDEYERNNN